MAHEKKQFENNNMGGGLFVSNYKQKPEDPTHTGSCKLDGVNVKIYATKKDDGTYDVELAARDNPDQRGEGEIHRTGETDSGGNPTFAGHWAFGDKEYEMTAIVKHARDSGMVFLSLLFSGAASFPAEASSEEW